MHMWLLLLFAVVPFGGIPRVQTCDVLECNITYRWYDGELHAQQPQIIAWKFDEKVGGEVVWWAWAKGREPVRFASGWWAVEIDGVQYRARQCRHSVTVGFDPEQTRPMPSNLRRGKLRIGQVQSLLVR